MRLTSLVPALFAMSSLALSLAGCAGGSGRGNGGSFTIALSSSMLLAPQDGTPAPVSVAITGTIASVTLSASVVPTGVNLAYKQPGTTGAGTVTFTASPAVAAGTYTVQIDATGGGETATPQSLALVVAVATVVSNTVDTSLGINGQLKQFMSTSFQPAEWDYQYFLNLPTTEPAQLNTLGPQHIRLQGISQAVPWKANSNPPAPNDWDFTMLDQVVQPVLSVTDNSPEFQIAVTPSFFTLPSPLTTNDPNLALFVSYCQNLVRYYNKGGFTWGGTTFQSASPHPITWWGIYNEYNINGLTPQDYVVLYNAVVPAMLAIDPSIKLSALELSDYDYTVGDPRNNLPTFVAPPASGGVNAQVDVASTHFYSTCNQSDTDMKLFSTIPGFVSDVEYFRQQFALRPDLRNVAVWVTENNVNADFADSQGNSTCNPGQKFVLDHRGTSAFFATWRPYVFSQLAKAGSQELNHWDYDADPQYGEVDVTTGSKYLSYWTDYTLGQFFPVTPSSAPDLLSISSTETATIEALATRNPDGSYVLLITNHAVNSANDNNGAGSPRSVTIDVTALGNYTSVTKTTLDASTDITNGPSAVSLTPAGMLSVTLGGYGTAILHIKP